MPRRSLLPVMIVSALACVAAPAASARTVRASARGVTATLSYRGRVPTISHLVLTVARGRSTLYRAPVTDDRGPEGCGSHCWPQTGGAQKAVQIADVQGDGAADVLVNLYTGGAHCCSVTEVLTPSAALGGRYVLTATHDFGDPGDELRRLGGRESFVTADDAFAYAFTDYAASGLPIEILQLSGGRFTDVTRRFPALVRTDAAGLLVAYVHARGSDNVGVLAAWAADECTLGRSRQALEFVEAQARAGRLNSGFGRADEGRRYVAALRRLLRRRGYLR